MRDSPQNHISDPDADVSPIGISNGHQADEDGEHDPEVCYTCLRAGDVVESACRCGQCCKLLIEVEVEDAEFEPRIKQLGSPIFTDARLTASGRPELEGYLLNSSDNNSACACLDRQSNLCTIYASRPLICRLFDCGAAQREQLIDLGIKSRLEEE